MPPLLVAIVALAVALAGFWLGCMTGGPWRDQWSARTKARFTAERWTMAFLITAGAFLLNWRLASSKHPEGTLTYVAAIALAGLLILPDIAELEISGVKLRTRLEREAAEKAGAAGLAAEKDAELTQRARDTPPVITGIQPTPQAALPADVWISQTVDKLRKEGGTTLGALAPGPGADEGGDGK